MAAQFCPQCGSRIDKEDRFCPHCGASLKTDASSAPERPTAPKSAQRPTGPLSPWVIGAIVVVGLMLLGAGIFLRNQAPDEPTLPLAAGSQPTVAAVQPTVNAVQPTTASAIPFPDVPRIGLQEAQDRAQNAGAIFVDVRDAEAYAAEHIPGALSIPLGPEDLDPAYQELDPNAEIITYCT